MANPVAIKGRNSLARSGRSEDAVKAACRFQICYPMHSELLAAARDDAKLIMDKDPELKTERGQALRVLLYLFEKDQGIQYLRSG